MSPTLDDNDLLQQGQLPLDPFADAEAPVGLSCRMYQTPDGAAGSPTLDQLRQLLAAR